jgi:hypothetical protein
MVVENANSADFRKRLDSIREELDRLGGRA